MIHQFYYKLSNKGTAEAKKTTVTSIILLLIDTLFWPFCFIYFLFDEWNDRPDTIYTGIWTFMHERFGVTGFFEFIFLAVICIAWAIMAIIMAAGATAYKFQEEAHSDSGKYLKNQIPGAVAVIRVPYFLISVFVMTYIVDWHLRLKVAYVLLAILVLLQIPFLKRLLAYLHTLSSGTPLYEMENWDDAHCSDKYSVHSLPRTMLKIGTNEKWYFVEYVDGAAKYRLGPIEDENFMYVHVVNYGTDRNKGIFKTDKGDFEMRTR